MRAIFPQKISNFNSLASDATKLFQVACPAWCILSKVCQQGNGDFFALGNEAMAHGHGLAVVRVDKASIGQTAMGEQAKYWTETQTDFLPFAGTWNIILLTRKNA